jgi:molybdate transport system substrate-binding protein
MRVAAVLIAGLLSLACVGTAGAAEIRVLSAGAVKSILEELAEMFRQETGHTVKATFGPVGATRQKLEAGEPADVVILTDVAIDDLAGRGLVVPGSRADVARTAIGVAVREGAPRPDIATPDAFKQTVLAAKSLVYVDPARGATSGIHFASVLQRLGIADAVKGKTILKDGGFRDRATRQLRTGSRAARTSSTRPTAVLWGADLRTSGSSCTMRARASAKASRVAFVSVSVGSIIRASSTRCGK